MVESINPPKGYFKIELLDKDRNVIDTFEKHNLVVNGSRPVLASHMAGRSTTPVNKLVLGTRGHIGNNLMMPKTANEGFTAARTQLFAEEEGEFCYNVNFTPPQSDGQAVVTEDDVGAGSTVEVTNSNNTITYRIELSTTAGNGTSGAVGYTEAGLYAGNDLFCMRTFAVRSKDVSSILRITWTLIF
ncbi:hypothetical protein F207_120 [Campylobacter phage F207]|uniref:Uncharacterized protein n=1 Tax=Campylobacter phage F207 TaxID=2794360 RepID=A0A7T3KCY9_9CAUD|nr:hypothetical protein F207_120 [Campylobacter phage F207]